MSFARAVASGFSAVTLLDQLAKRYPQYAEYIRNAERMGFRPQTILRKLDQEKNKSNEPEAAYMTDFERAQQGFEKSRKDTRGSMAKAGIAAAGLAAGGLAAASRGGAAAGGIRGGVVYPSEIVVGAEEASGPLALPGGGQARLPYGGPKQPRGPRTPSPSTGPITPPYKHNPQQNQRIIKKMGLDKPVSQALGSGLGVAAVAQHLRERLPKNKIALLEKAPGGLEQALEDYLPIVQGRESESTRQKSLKEFNERLKKQKEEKHGLVEKEIDRFNEAYSQQPPNEPGASELAGAALGASLAGGGEQENIESASEIQATPRGGLEEETITQVGTEAIASPQAKPKELDPSSFYIPNYKHPDEDRESFVKRKRLTDVLNKAADMLKKGESFLDLPKPPGVQYSTDVDVLRFLAGMPNVYDPLLSDDEKVELWESLDEPKGSRPSMRDTAQSTLDEGNIYGAQMAPSLVWNLLLAIDPKVKDLVPPSIKGAKDKPAGGKMGTTEARRFLTHAVYRIAGGDRISNELADKINRISKATSHLDMMLKAIKAGNMKRMQKEMENLMDDDYFAAQMEAVTDELIADAKAGRWNISPEELKARREAEKADAKSASAIKSAITRRKKKESG